MPVPCACPVNRGVRRLALRGGAIIMNRVTRCASLLLWVVLTTTLIQAQTNNLLQEPNADDGSNYWRPYGNATVEQTDGGNWRFVVRNKGYFLQDVTLPDGAIGKFALFIGRASSERINADGAITGLPYLYGYMMESADPRGGRIK